MTAAELISKTHWQLRCLSCYLHMTLIRAHTSCEALSRVWVIYVPLHHLALDEIETDSQKLLISHNVHSSLYTLTLDAFVSLCLNCRLNVFSSSLDTMSTISPTDFDSLEIQQQYNDINNRWDLAAETDWDNENSSARLFERSRIKALAGMLHFRPD